MSYRLDKISFTLIDGLDDDDFLSAFETFRTSCAHIVQSQPELRPALQASESLKSLATKALTVTVSSNSEAKAFFKAHFQPHRIQLESEGVRGFVTGYYEPVIEASEVQSINFPSPILGRPSDLVTFAGAREDWPLGPDFSAGRKRSNGAWQAYPSRAEIEVGTVHIPAQPIAFVRDAIEAYMVQVQGSARLRMRDGQTWRLTYAGRNGRPYSSIGKYLIQEGAISPEGMSLASLKSWLRANGLQIGERARNALWRNESFVFFDVTTDATHDCGPIGGQGVPLTPLRSIAVDRAIWPYGLPFWLSAEKGLQSHSHKKFERLMIAQDTGSAIIGPARADIFFGTGDEAGFLAGNVRHACDFIVFLPREGF